MEYISLHVVKNSNDLLSAVKKAHPNQTHKLSIGIGRDLAEMPQHVSLTSTYQ